MNQYIQLTLEERVLMSHLRWQGLSYAKIANQLGRHRSTIYREFERNSCHRIDSAYRPTKANARALSRRHNSRSIGYYTLDDYLLVCFYLRKQWSPEQICGYLRRQGLRAPSHETIYRYIWDDKACGGKLFTYLRQSIKKRRKRHNSQDSRGRLAGKRHISERPKSVESRRFKGHWEINTVVSRASKDCIVTINERKSGYVLIGKLVDRTTDSLNKKTTMLINRNPNAFKSITADNGTEFNQYKDIESKTPVTFYFANPYHSWERGSNENLNGLIRQYLPRGSSMESLTQPQCDRIAQQLNTRPRKRFGYKTPEEIFYDL
ncbi:IS30 family transposase [Alteromonadaceae bacterium 2753L.S.0a.02]|nr:IS30 family transposase [Alteromonadaceae bacterium 2753L.S.0a.02]